MAQKGNTYENALKGRKIPILVLDHKWHRLFDFMEPDKAINKMEEELNNLLKQQGKLNSQMKDIKRIKKRLMDEIMELMEKEDASSERKRDENRRLIEECNEKMDAFSDELLDLPVRIHEVNHDLMVHTMEMCYQVLKTNEKDILEISRWIDQVRIDLKKNIIRKQDKEIINQEMYSYMHDILGPHVIEVFDMKYNPLERQNGKKGEKE
ncbi:MAG: hypothetical protein PUI46_08305 [Lachnospiraceae bacterium]|nr:hypothetical protein [Lachnospiraceae bacterium]